MTKEAATIKSENRASGRFIFSGRLSFLKITTIASAKETIINNIKELELSKKTTTFILIIVSNVLHRPTIFLLGSPISRNSTCALLWQYILLDFLIYRIQ